jgi:Flp pilus assembly protein TadD
VNGTLRGVVIPALLVAACIGIATMLAVPDEGSEQELSAEEIARIDSFVARFRQGQRLMGGGKDDDAEAVFRALIEEEPEAAAVHHALGLLLQFRGFPNEATAAFLRAAELAPKDASIQRDAGIDLLRRGHPADAEPYLAKAHELWPKEVEILVAHAAALRAIGRHHEARAAYRAAVAVEPNSVDACVGLAAAVVEQKPERALELVTGLPHAFVDVSLVHGLALVKLDRADEAVAHLVTATNRPPMTPAAKAVLVAGARALGRLGAAKETAAATALWCASERGAPGLEASLLLAQSLSALDRSADGLQVIAQANKEGAEPPIVRQAPLIRASLLLSLGKTAEARAAFDVAADSEVGSPERAIARRALDRIDAAALAGVMGKTPSRRNDAAWAESLRATLAGDDDAAAVHVANARKLSDPPGEFPGLLLR